ncbi:very short patch repair endonuclease [Microvirga thermotolerans]|uniref:Very short patch repair endonuclease n=1 Tax=Microvirga thermotolerans TaxID=2651334 RepID=A0A5P9JUP1_9HYPH|nr:very short patch repair endonuclease [Microvirga thermotolerans]QFU15498.1 DNA mismatch endonuclease Vsr [Microvirga thermotolerans]
MADTQSAERRSENMRRIKSKDTKPELLVRRMVHAMGYRYRLHRKDLAGKPDLVFGPRRKIIFVHGCFWHGHNDPACPDRREVKSNQTYWNPKIARNQERDLAHQAALEAAGWKVLTVWECETRDREALAARIKGFLEG